MSAKHAIVIGAGAGGLAASIDLAREGFRVTLLERGDAPGGKMHIPPSMTGRSMAALPC